MGQLVIGHVSARYENADALLEEAQAGLPQYYRGFRRPRCPGGGSFLLRIDGGFLCPWHVLECLSRVVLLCRMSLNKVMPRIIIADSQQLVACGLHATLRSHGLDRL